MIMMTIPWSNVKYMPCCVSCGTVLCVSDGKTICFFGFVAMVSEC